MRIIILYSVLLLSTSGVAVACGIYATQGNYKPLTHRLFLLLVGTVVVWAFGLALTGAAATELIAFIGRRVAPLGWGLLAGAGLHFALAFTGHTAFLKKWWSVPLIYLPSAVTILSFSILPLFGQNPDTLTQTSYGWINVSQVGGADVWDWFYYGYTALYASLGAALLIRWGRRSQSENKKKQARVVAWSFLISCLLGAATDVIPAFMEIPLPQVSAIFMNVLILAAGYSISRYQFLQPEEAGREELILSKAQLAHVYRYLGLIMLLGGIALLFVTPVFHGAAQPLPTFSVGAVVSAIGLFLLFLDRMDMDEKLKEMLVSLGIALFIPLMLLWFSAMGIHVTWALIFPLMIICMLFNRQIILATLIASWLLSELFLWGYQPTSVLNISSFDFLIRFGIIGFVAFSAVYVNRVYTRRLQENINHTAMQAISTEISHNFVSVSGANIEAKLYQTLARCGAFIQCDNACLAMLDRPNGDIQYAVHWTAQEAGGPPVFSEAFLKEMRPLLLDRLKDGDILTVRDTLLMQPNSFMLIRDRLVAEGVRGLVAVPIKRKSEIIGLLGFYAGRPLRRWNLSSPTFIGIAAGIISDAVVKVEGERALTHMAYHDQLTGLPNRIRFRQKLDESIANAKETGRMAGVVFLDLDGFKSVNDMLGHDQGDRLLVETARTLAGAVRAQDTVARFGGDEFMLLFTGISVESELLAIMDRLMETIQKPVMLAGQEFFISISAGVAIYPQDGADSDTLLKNADTSMYEAKAAGKSRYLLCSKEMKDRVMEKVRLTNLLYRAQENDQLLLYYQPQIDLESQRIVGLEALLRWNLPNEGMIGPATFIPLAEQTGLIHSIGSWVLLRACAACIRLHEIGCDDLRMAVNISVHQLKNPNFVGVVRRALQSTGLPPQYLELEITEGIANGNTDCMAAALGQLKEVGVSISIDDFGTEYSSLSRLKALPIDRIKMDMQFVRGIGKNEKDQAISKVIINLAKSLHIKVLAEGVETAPQLGFLSQRRCDEIQGYYYYKPMPFEEMEEILKKQLREQTSGRAARRQARV